jgi:hypothetical protein
MKYVDPSGYYSQYYSMMLESSADGDKFYYRGEYVTVYDGVGYSGHGSPVPLPLLPSSYYSYDARMQMMGRNNIFWQSVNTILLDYGHGYTITQFNMFGALKYVGHFGPLGKMNAWGNGAISFENVTAGMHQIFGEVYSRYNINRAANWLNDNAHRSWRDAKGECGIYVRRAPEEGFGMEIDALAGKTVDQSGDNRGCAKTMGPYLENLGFQPLNTTNYLKGDIAVIQGFEGNRFGHTQMYTDSIWISDFLQLNGFWPGPDYRTFKPSFEIYRWGN